MYMLIYFSNFKILILRLHDLMNTCVVINIGKFVSICTYVKVEVFLIVN